MSASKAIGTPKSGLNLLELKEIFIKSTEKLVKDVCNAMILKFWNFSEIFHSR